MSEISSFEQFKETFDAYFSKWWKIASYSIGVCLPTRFWSVHNRNSQQKLQT